MTYTDFLDNPVNVGDIITYPTCSGSSAADLNMGVIVAIDDIIPNNPSDPTDRYGYLHKDRLKANPTMRVILGRWRESDGEGRGDFFRDDSKAYMLQVTRLREGSSGRSIYNPERVVTLKNVDRVVVVTSLTDQREPIL